MIERETVSLILAIVAMIIGGVSIGMGISNLAYILSEIRQSRKNGSGNTCETKHDV